MNEKDIFLIGDIPGFTPQIGRLVSMMPAVRRPSVVTGPDPRRHRSEYPQTIADSLERFDGAIQVFTHVRGGNLSAESGLALRHDRIP